MRIMKENIAMIFHRNSDFLIKKAVVTANAKISISHLILFRPAAMKTRGLPPLQFNDDRPGRGIAALRPAARRLPG